MKKIIALLLALTMCMGMTALAGEFETVLEKGEYTLPLVTEPTELVYMVRDSEEPGTSFLNGNSLTMNKLMEMSGVTLVFDCVPNNDYKTVMDLRLASQTDLPDILSLQGTQDGAHIVRYYEDGILVPLNQLMADYAPNLSRIYAENPELKKPMTLPDGELAAIGNLSAVDGFHAIAIRLDWLEALDLEMPKNPDELIEVALAFMEKDPNGNGQNDELGMVGGGLFEFRQPGSLFGLSLCTGSGWMLSEDNQVICCWTDDAYRDYLRFMNKAYTMGAIPKDFASYDYEQFNARHANGTIGISTRTFVGDFVYWLLPDAPNQINQPGSMWVPIIFEEYQGYKDRLTMEPKAEKWRSNAITIDAKDKALAMRFLDFVMAGEGSEVHRLGIEGVNYTWNDDGILVPNDAWRDTYEDKDAFLGNWFFSAYNPKDYTAEGRIARLENEVPEVYAKVKPYLDDIAKIATPAFQSPIPTQEEGVRLSQIATDMNTYRDEMLVKFINGELSIETEWDAYVEQMNAIGADEMREIYQRGVDNVG